MSYSPPRRTYKILGEREWDWLIQYPMFANPENGQFDTRTGGPTPGSATFGASGAHCDVPADGDYGSFFILQSGGIWAATPGHRKWVLGYLFAIDTTPPADQHCLGFIDNNVADEVADDNIAVYDVLNARLLVDKGGTDYTDGVTNPTLNAFNSCLLTLDFEEGRSDLRINKNLEEPADASVDAVPNINESYHSIGFMAGGTDATEERIFVQGFTLGIIF